MLDYSRQNLFGPMFWRTGTDHYIGRKEDIPFGTSAMRIVYSASQENKIRGISNAVRDTKKAFTLIELVMVMVIVGILVGIGGPVARELIGSFQHTIYKKDISESADVIFRRMTREIRRLRSVSDVLVATASVYSFVDADDVTVRFRLNGSNIERQYHGDTDVLATNVSALTITYLDDNGIAIATPLVSPQDTNIKSVQIDITLTSGGNEINFRTCVKLRNIRHASDLFS